MATRKTSANKAVSKKSDSTTTRQGRRSKGRRSIEQRVSELLRSPRHASSRADLVKYIVPGVVATGALVAAGYGLKDQLGDIVESALKAAAKQGARASTMTSKAMAGASDGAHDAIDRVSETFSVDSLLKVAGLQRRSTMMSVLSPTLGAFCGFIAGSALTFWFGPQLMEGLTRREARSPANDDAQPSPTGTEPEPAMANGMRHGIS